MIIEIEASYQAANDYSLFQGATSAGYEGGWYGFKRTDNKSSYALVFIGSFGLCQAVRNGSGNWFLYRMSNSIY